MCASVNRFPIPYFLYGAMYGICTLGYRCNSLGADDKGCAYCGGLDHRITDCPKLEAMQQKQAGSIGKKDYLANSSADW